MPGAKKGRKRARSEYENETCVTSKQQERERPSSTATAKSGRQESKSIYHDLPVILSQKPLSNSGSQIRLLQVCENEDENQDVLRFSITVQNLPEARNFIAISYTWGNEQDPQYVYIDGWRCSVRRNCYEALQQTCSKRNVVQCDLIWIDSICINQKDEDEKGLQVSIMGDIYARATHVFACVGSHANKSEFVVEKAREVADFDYNCNHADFLCPDCRGPWEKWTLSLGIKRLSRLCKACEAFGKRDYWYRVWIIQETAKARSLSIVCGADMLPWKVLNNLEGYLGLDLEEMPGVMEEYKRLPTCETNAMHDVLVSRKSPIEMGDVFSLYSESLCSDPRDHLYGLLNLIKWPAHMTPIFPNYHISAFDLAVQVEAYLSFERVPDMLVMFQITSNNAGVQNSIQQRRDQSIANEVDLADEAEERFRSVYEGDGMYICGWVRNDEHGNLTADLVKNRTVSGVLSYSTSSDDVSDDSSNSENLEDPSDSVISMLSSARQGLAPKMLTLGPQIAGFVCDNTVAGDILVPVQSQAGQFYLVLRHDHGEYFKIIGQAVLLPGYEFGCSPGLHDDETEVELFEAEVKVNLGSEDTVILFAQDMDGTKDFFNEENHWKRVLTSITRTHLGAARVSMHSKLRAKDVTLNRGNDNRSMAGSLIEFIEASKDGFAEDAGNWAVGTLNNLPNALRELK